MILWRPVGLDELRLIFRSGMAAFPPRLPEQPIFYPVLTEVYADQIARDWNATQPPYAGYVLRFEVEDDFASSYSAQTVGAANHRELWVPAEELPAFNAHIAGPIAGIRAFFDSRFTGEVPTGYGLRGKSAMEQIVALTRAVDYSTFDVAMETRANAAAVFLNYPYWIACGSDRLQLPAADFDLCLQVIRGSWESARGELIAEARLIS